MKNVFLSLWQLGIIKKYANGKEGISMSRYRTRNKQYCMIVSRFHYVVSRYHLKQKCAIVVLSIGQSSYSCRAAILYIYIQEINNENISDDWAWQMRKYQRNETVMIYFIIMYIVIDLIASQVIAPSQIFYPTVNLHVFWPKATSNGILPLCHCLCLLVSCNYVSVYSETGQMSSESTFTLSSDTFD